METIRKTYIERLKEKYPDADVLIFTVTNDEEVKNILYIIFRYNEHIDCGGDGKIPKLGRNSHILQHSIDIHWDEYIVFSTKNVNDTLKYFKYYGLEPTNEFD